ncbi:MAG: pilus assembly PilX family protein [Nevskiales bacterium]
MKTPLYPRRRQQGMTLVIGLIMLIMISLAAVASYQMSKTSTEVIGNMQFQNEAVASADSVIQEAVSRVNMFKPPRQPLPNPCGGVTNQRCFDFNQDGTTDVRVVMTEPTCVKARPKPNAELKLNEAPPPGEFLPRDAACSEQVGQTAGIEGTMAGNSKCAETTWQIVARATDTVTNTDVTVTQGTDVRISTEEADTVCP